MPARIVVLASGSGTLLQSVIDAAATGRLDADVVAVGSDVPGVMALTRAEQAGIPVFVERPGRPSGSDGPGMRPSWAA